MRSGKMAGGVGASVHSYNYYSLYCNRSHIHLTRSIQIERLRYRGGASHPPHPSETPGDCRGTLGRPLRETPSAGSYAGAALWRCRRCWKGTYGRGEGGERTGKGRCERGVGMKMDGREGRWCWRRWRAGRGARVRVFTVCKKSCSLRQTCIMLVVQEGVPCAARTNTRPPRTSCAPCTSQTPRRPVCRTLRCPPATGSVLSMRGEYRRRGVRWSPRQCLRAGHWSACHLNQQKDGGRGRDEGC